MTPKRDPSTALQIGFVALLAVCCAQAVWWIADQVDLANEDRNRVALLYQADAEVLAELLRAAHEAQADVESLAARLQARTPHVAIDDAGNVEVRPEALVALADEAASRINRYAWEGAFFLLVLMGGMAFLVRAIRNDARLRRRQQNFLATVSHEFKSPLASMRLSAETLALRAADAESRRLGQRMIEDGDRLLNMVDNLLDTARIEEGRVELRRAPIRLAAVVEAACSRLADEAGANHVEIAVDIAADIHIGGDRLVVETVLRNLLDNALKACIGGSGSNISVSAELAKTPARPWSQAKQTHPAVTVTIADDGAGFPPADAKVIFDKFYRAPHSRMPGTGLGLYIVGRLVALSGASVSAASDGPGKGATLTLTWPLHLERQP